eukprot:sb/3469849/
MRGASIPHAVESGSHLAPFIYIGANCASPILGANLRQIFGANWRARPKVPLYPHVSTRLKTKTSTGKLIYYSARANLSKSRMISPIFSPPFYTKSNNLARQFDGVLKFCDPTRPSKSCVSSDPVESGSHLAPFIYIGANCASPILGANLRQIFGANWRARPKVPLYPHVSTRLKTKTLQIKHDFKIYGNFICYNTLHKVYGKVNLSIVKLHATKNTESL